MAETFLTGQTGKVTAGATDLNVTGWSVEPSVDTHETTHSGSSGYATHISSVKRLTGSFTAAWDSSAEPTATPPNLNPGEEVALKLYLESAGAYIEVDNAIITSIPITSEVAGLITYTCNFLADGSFSLPT